MSKCYFTNYFEPNVSPEALKYWGKTLGKEKKKIIAQMSSVCECVCEKKKKISKVLAARNCFSVLNLVIQKAENELLNSTVTIFHFIMPSV